MKPDASAQDPERPQCAACDSCDWKSVPETDGGAYLRCRCCHFHIQVPHHGSVHPDDRFEEEQQRFYGQDPLCVSPLFAYLQQQRIGRRMKVLQRYLQTGRVLEVGPGGGDLLSGLAELGYQVDAVEHSPTLAALIHERWGVNVRVGAFEELPFGDTLYDALLSFHVIEHVPDAAAHLEKAARVVRRGGYAFIATPNADSWEHRMPCGLSPNYSTAHLQLFTPRSLTLLLEKTGWQVVARSTPSYADAWLRVAASVVRRVRGQHRSAERGRFARGSSTRRRKGYVQLFDGVTRPVRRVQELLQGGNELLLIAQRAAVG